MVQAMDKQDAMVDDAEDIPFGDGDETQSSDS
jgi:hypothetical protein